MQHGCVQRRMDLTAGCVIAVAVVTSKKPQSMGKVAQDFTAGRLWALADSSLTACSLLGLQCQLGPGDFPVGFWQD